MARKTVRRWIWAWRFDVEERWLNEEAAGGNLLAGLNMLQYSGWCVINLMFAAVLGYGTYCLHLKKKRLEGERVLHE